MDQRKLTELAKLLEEYLQEIISSGLNSASIDIKYEPHGKIWKISDSTLCPSGFATVTGYELLKVLDDYKKLVHHYHAPSVDVLRT